MSKFVKKLVFQVKIGLNFGWLGKIVWKFWLKGQNVSKVLVFEVKIVQFSVKKLSKVWF